MALAVWVVGAFALVVFLGTWALQLALVLVQITLRLTGWLALFGFGLTSLVVLAFTDREALARLWGDGRGHGDNPALLSREQWP